MRTPMTRTGSRTLAAIALAAGVAPALAQDAMGTGRELENSLYVDTRVGGGGGLDSSLRVDTRFNAPRPDFAAELQFRNAIATGNAPGGLSFRGDVGYSAPFEFRGELGSDALYPFRRDSLYSGLGGMGIRGTEALQYQFALTAGARVPRDLMGSLVVARDPGGDATSGEVRTGGGAPTPTIGRVQNPDALGALYGQIRSPSSYTANRGYAPFLLTTTRAPDAEGNELEIGITATPLRGVRAEPMGGQGSLAESLRAPSTLDTSTRAETERVETAYDEVMRRLRERAGSEPQPEPEAGQAPEWMRQLEELRQQLLGNLTPPEPGEEGAEPGEGTDPGQTPGATPGQGSGDEEESDAAAQARPVKIEFDPETMRLLRDTGEPVSDLVSEGVGDPYAEHMRAGQRLLGSGQYFDAEERFTRALSIRQGDTTAQIGRVHAQLGAGMFLSAALNLRTTLVGTPSLTATRYRPSLLPEPGRIDELKLTLRENIGLVERPGASIAMDPRMRHESALLLAYLGYQSGDQRAVREGLDAFEATPDVGTRGGGSGVDERLGTLLRELWVRPGSGEE